MSIDAEALRLAQDAHKAAAALVQRLETAWSPSRFRGSLLDFAGASESLLEDVVARLKEKKTMTALSPDELALLRLMAEVGGS